MRRMVPCLMTLLVFCTLLAGHRVAWAGYEFPICTDPSAQYYPAIAGDIAAWSDHRNSTTSSADVYGYDISTGLEFPITTAPANQFEPAVSGNIVVWWDDSGPGMDRNIYGHDLTTHEDFPICTRSGEHVSPDVSGDIVVWATDGEWPSSDIYGYDLSTGLEFPVCTAPANQRAPAISGNIVVWEDARNYGTTGLDIYGFNLDTEQEFAICTAPGDQRFPDVSGDIVVWADSDIYGYRVPTHEQFAICTAPGSQRYPAISGDIVVWNGVDGIYAYYLQTNHEFRMSATGDGFPDVSGNVAVWNSDSDIYGYVLFPGPPVVVETVPGDATPRVSFDSLVTARFSEPMHSSTINATTFQVVGATHGSIPGTITYDSITWTATFSPAAVLAEDTYTVTITGGIGGVRDTEQEAMESNHVWTFTVPPPPGLDMNAGDLCTGSRGVLLGVACAEWGEVRFRDGAGAWGVWEPCAATKAWTLPLGDGPKWVCVQGRDAEMNLSNETCDDILLDATAPAAPQISINGGASCTYSTSATLTVSCDPDCTEVRFRNDPGAWGPWEPYSTLRPWTLPSGAGVQLVCSQCRDVCGMESPVGCGEIIIPTFDDVDCDSSQLPYVEALVSEGITSGCSVSPPLYCPTSGINRAQMAVFIIRAMGETPYANPTPTFQDVSSGHWAYGYIERMNQLHITTGCSTNPPLYCPNSPVTRAQMAVFLCRAAGKPGLATPTPTFADVPASHWAYGYIERMADPDSWGGSPVTSGCAVGPPRLYCPNSPNTRGQMAVFLVRAFGIPY